MPPPITRPKGKALQSQKPVTSSNQPLGPPSKKPPNIHSAPKARSGATSSRYLRPTGTYPGQLAPITKRISLPPPGEMTQHAEEHLRAPETGEARAAAARTTKGKTKKERKGKDDGKDCVGAAKHQGENSGRVERQQQQDKAAAVRGRGRLRGKGKPAKMPGLMKVLEMQSRTAGFEVSETGELTYIPFTSRFVSSKVQRARQQQRQERGDDMSSEGVLIEPRDEMARMAGGKKVFPFLDLPQIVKTQIYRLLVVETKLCVWPATKTGREQPDMSLVCREIREAILPIYYGENTFAVDTAPPIATAKDTRAAATKTGSASTRTPLAGLAAVQKWAEVLSVKQSEGGKWFGLVKNWCFSYRNPLVGFGGSETASNTTESIQDFVVSVRVCKGLDRTGEGMEVGSVYQRARPGHIVEVHREAACIMPGWSDHGRCIAQKTPGTLMLAADSWLQSNREASEGLGEFVLELRKIVGGLAAACCTQMPHGVGRPDALP
ncbi:hypothetical protein CERZMDRAFT_95575 [Cercospora zeae-maydis SCOH1-5]|uniref:Uncharacterized protein n=1 Tax=Cercospora zeae-maydis SCOH1-5 TaxID=717836 RepID=A0A6A6FLF8_9PEZI|nr:hypothetical protein CERZMDRAFT_95575 [Cercospora zeae-maydis SCOH1-5]